MEGRKADGRYVVGENNVISLTYPFAMNLKKKRLAP